MKVASNQSRASAARILDDLLVAPGVLVARCGCGAVTRLDDGLAGGLRRASLARLEGELRCSCGARRGSIELRPPDFLPPPSVDRLYLFGG